LHKLWATMGVTLGKRASVVAVILVITTIVLGLGTPRLEFATGQDSYLNRGEAIYDDNIEYQSLFGGQAMVTVFTMEEGATVTDLFTPANVAQMQEIAEELRGADGILAVVSPLDALQFTQDIVTRSPDGEVVEDVTQSVAGQALLAARDMEPDPAAQELRLADAGETLVRLSEVPPEARTFENPDWIDFLLFDNRGAIRKALRPFFPDTPTAEGEEPITGRNAQFVTRLAGNLSIEDEGIAADVVSDAFEGRTWENATAVTTGAAVLLKDLNDYLRGGFLILGGIAVVLMVLILLLTFNVRWRLLPLGIILIGVIWAFGLAGYIGIPLSVVTISGLPVLLGIGIDFAIQMHSRIEEEVQLDRADHPIQETTTNLVPPLIIATLAAAIAFLALLLSDVPMIRDFGVLLALGIAVVLIADVVITTTVLGNREYRRPTPPRDYTIDRISRFVVWLGSLPRAAVPFLVVGSIAVLLTSLFLEDRLVLQTDPEEWVNQDSQVIADIDVLKEQTGSSAELGIFVRAEDPFADETVRFVHEFATSNLDRYPGDLLTASSIVTTVSFLLEIPDATSLPPRGIDVANAYAVAPPDVQRSTVSPDGEALNLIFRTGPASLDERAVYVNEIREALDPPPGIDATPSGIAVIGVGLLENLRANRVLLTYVALGAVFVFLCLRLMSLARGILAIIPVAMGVGASTIVAFAAGFKLSPLTALGGPLVIAACTEFTSLIMTRYLEERRRGLDPREASNVASARTGRAFVASALATVAGVGVLATSTLPLLRDFGYIVTINVTVALLSALVILPPLVVWADSRGWVHKDRPAGRSAGRSADRPADRPAERPATA
jgi:uncharacterized protein